MRKIPQSRLHPHVGRDQLERWVPRATDSAYIWEPALGGFRKPAADSSNVALRNPAFRAYADYMQTGAFGTTLDDLLARCAVERTAIMCSESVWWRCHRRLIADAALLLHGAKVEHLMHDGKLQAHLPTQGVRVAAAGMLLYDVLTAGAVLPMGKDST